MMVGRTYNFALPPPSGLLSMRLVGTKATKKNPSRQSIDCCKIHFKLVQNTYKPVLSLDKIGSTQSAQPKQQKKRAWMPHPGTI